MAVEISNYRLARSMTNELNCYFSRNSEYDNLINFTESIIFQKLMFYIFIQQIRQLRQCLHFLNSLDFPSFRQWEFEMMKK